MGEALLAGSGNLQGLRVQWLTPPSFFGVVAGIVQEAFGIATRPRCGLRRFCRKSMTQGSSSRERDGRNADSKMRMTPRERRSSLRRCILFRMLYRGGGISVPAPGRVGLKFSERFQVLHR